MIEAGGFVLITAFIMDLFLGDPRYLPHPVAGMGKAISFFEPKFRRVIKNSLAAGAFFMLFLVGITYVLALVLIWLAGQIHPLLGMGGQVTLLFFLFFHQRAERCGHGRGSAFDIRRSDNRP